MEELKFLKGNEINLPDYNLREKATFYITNDTGKIILGNHIWDSNNTKYTQITSGKSNTDYILYMDGVEVFKVPIIRFDVKIETIGCNISKFPNKVEYGSNLSLTITNKNPNINKELVSIGGIDKTKECLKNNTIKINNITGNVYIILNYN